MTKSVKPRKMAMKVQTTEQITRPVKYRKIPDEEYKLPEPEYSIPTQDHHTLRLDETVNVQRFNTRLRVENIRRWIDHTKPNKIPFEERSNISTWSDVFPQHDSDELSTVAVSDTIQEEWNQREFDRLFGKILQKYELSQDIDHVECRKINEKVKRYKKAFLKGFFDARIRRIESNKWLYDKLHVNTESIKEKYRRLMYTSEPIFSTVAKPDLTQPEIPAEDNAEKPTDEQDNKDADTQCEEDLESVYSFVPERDNVMLQDINAPPHVRGFGKDKLKRYNKNIKLLNLDNWVPHDIQEWLNDNKSTAESEDEPQPDPNDKYKNIYIDNIQAILKPQQKKIATDWRYEQITGISELPVWLGPKVLDPKPERDLENFMKTSEIDVDEDKNIIDEEKRADNIPPPDIPEDDNKSQVSKAESESVTRERLLRQLIQSQSKDYYKLWYNTHDTFNSTPFLEARLQRLMQEALGKREWALYCTYLKKKHDDQENKQNPKT